MRVFLSSTWTDLVYERQVAYWTLKSLGHEPIWMEDYGSRPASSWETCASRVEAADLVLLIIGRRYGSELLDAGRSFTESEYELAQILGIPTLVFAKAGPTDYDDSDNPLRMQEFYRLAADERQISHPLFDDVGMLATAIVQALADGDVPDMRPPTFHSKPRTISAPSKYATAAVRREVLDFDPFRVVIADLAVLAAPTYPEDVKRRIANKALQVRADLRRAHIDADLFNELDAYGNSAQAVQAKRTELTADYDVLIALVSSNDDVERLDAFRPHQGLLIVCYPARLDEPKLEDSEVLIRYTQADLLSCRLVTEL